MPERLYNATDRMIGKSKIDGFSIYEMEIDGDIGAIDIADKTKTMEKLIKIIRRHKIACLAESTSRKKETIENLEVFCEYYGSDDSKFIVLLPM